MFLTVLLFKIDNVDSFKLSVITAGLLTKKAKTKSQWIKMALDEDIDFRISAVNDEFYPLIVDGYCE